MDEINENGYIKGALHLDFFSPDLNQKIALLDVKKPYFAYCRSGMRSGKFAVLLESSNFERVFSLNNGFAGWAKDNFPVEVNSKEPI